MTLLHPAERGLGISAGRLSGVAEGLFEESAKLRVDVGAFVNQDCGA